MPGQLVTVATFDLVPKARLAQNVLEKAGIKSVVADENIVAMDWLFGNAVGWVKVQVLEEEAERAVEALEESLGHGDVPIDPEDLAAQAEAAGSDEEEEPPRSTETLNKESGEAELDATGVDGGRTMEDAKPFERDEYARRLFFSTVFAVVVPPLWFYSIHLFLNAAFGEGPISARGRSQLIYGSAIMGAGLFVLFLLFSFIPRSMFD